MPATSRRGVVRPKLFWRVGFPVLGLLGVPVARGGGVGAWGFVVGCLAFGILANTSRLVVESHAVSQPLLFGKGDRISFDELSEVQLRRRLDVPVTPLPLVLTLRSSDGTEIEVETWFWGCWRWLASIIAEVVDNRGLAVDPATRERLARY